MIANADASIVAQAMDAEMVDSVLWFWNGRLGRIGFGLNEKELHIDERSSETRCCRSREVYLLRSTVEFMGSNQASCCAWTNYSTHPSRPAEHATDPPHCHFFTWLKVCFTQYTALTASAGVVTANSAVLTELLGSSRIYQMTTYIKLFSLYRCSLC